MLRQVSLAVQVPPGLQGMGRKSDARVSIIDCKDFNDKGMTMLLDVAAPKEKMEDAIGDLKKTGYFRRVYAAQSGNSRSVCVAVLDRPSICQASLDSGVICLTCPYNGESDQAMWKILVRDSDTLKSFLSRLEKLGIKAQIREVSDATQDDELTPRQREILSKAISLGFYEFPRKIDLTSLSKEVNVKPSSLSEILRNAERKVLSRYSDPYLIGRKTEGLF